jgi:uncharacterized protein YhbP (UPF0306 family)
MEEKLNKLAKMIIKNNEYTTLATSDSNGAPWVSILAYSYDTDWNLYFVSIPKSKHGQQLERKRMVACSIFDSRQDWGKGVGLQIEAKCKIISENEFKHVSKVYFERKYPYGKVEPDTKKFFKKSLSDKNSLYKFYKIEPKTVWMNNPYSKTDVRVSINLNK